MDVDSLNETRCAALAAAPHNTPLRETIQGLRIRLAEDPGDLDALGRLGDAQLADHDPDGALTTAITAIELDPERDLPHRQASIAASRRGLHRDAIAHAEDAVRLAPGDHRGFVVLARSLLRAKRDLARARRVAVQAIVRAPEEAEPHLVFGMVSRAEGEYAAAEAGFRRALQLEPTNMAARNELARLEVRRAIQTGSGTRMIAVPAPGGAEIRETRIAAARRNLDAVRALQARLRARRATA